MSMSAYVGPARPFTVLVCGSRFDKAAGPVKSWWVERYRSAA